MHQLMLHISHHISHLYPSLSLVIVIVAVSIKSLIKLGKQNLAFASFISSPVVFQDSFTVGFLSKSEIQAYI